MTLYDIDKLKQCVSQSLCWSDVCRHLKISVCTFNFKRIQKLCKENQISTTHFDIKKSFKRNKFYWTAENLFVKDSKATRTIVRDYIKRHKLLDYSQCSMCGIKNEWNGKSLRLELDHANGDYTDNRLKNLRILCPNCHSQTNTFKKGKAR